MSFLDNVIKEKFKEIEMLEERRSLIDGIQKTIAKGKIPVIAEFKRKSPSSGRFVELNILEATRQMENGGACAISVLTDKNNFDGSLEDLKKVKRNVKIPVFRKDFIVSEFQLYESFAYGADAILLIAKILNGRTKHFTELAKKLGLEVLIEVHDEHDLKAALESGAELIGINNRDLKTLKVDLNTTEKLAKKIPKDKIIVTESGIKNKQDVKKMIDAGAHAALIGTSLMEAESIEDKVRGLTEK